MNSTVLFSLSQALYLSSCHQELPLIFLPSACLLITVIQQTIMDEIGSTALPKGKRTQSPQELDTINHSLDDEITPTMP